MSTDRTAAPAEPDAVQPSDAPIPAWFDNLAGLSWRFLVVAASAMAIIWVLAILDVLLLPMFLALLFASAFLPLDRRLRRLLGRPGLSAATCLLLLLTGLAVVITVTLSALINESATIGNALDRGWARVSEAAADADLVPTGTADADEDVASRAAGAVGRYALTGARILISATIDLATTLLLSLFITFFLLKDGGMMWRWMVDRFGGGSTLLDTTGRRSFNALAGYVRGAALVSFVDASCIALGAWALGVPFPMAIFVLTFIMGFIPYVGAFAAGAFAAVLAVASGGLGNGLAMIAVVLVVQQLETNLLQPVIMGKSTSLHPLVVALASVAGGALAGLFGVFVAIPVAAATVAAFAALNEAGYFDDRRRRPLTIGEQSKTEALEG
ncbi:MAG: AI-2E family transporter [Microthrixaceae bacterium]|nr:AI-2E family transporter [Acidimicrobiales bacterium]MCB9402925.1 AI-2E family transporter [Microthrixaceae bacterium]